MDLATLTSVFGWMSLFHILFLLLTGLMLTVGRSTILGIHRRLTGLSDEELSRLYISFLANYKIAALVTAFVPWIALKMVA